MPRISATRRLRAAHVVNLVLTVASWAALVVFALASVGSALWGAGTFVGTHTFELFAPWAAIDPAPPPISNQWLGDTVDAVIPRTLLIKHALLDGDLAQWNPYTVGGTAAAPLPDGANFSPLSLPWYVLPDVYAPGAVKLVEIAVLTVGMSLFLRRLGLRSATWALASLVLASSGYMVAWTNWAQTRVGALVPLLFWAVDRAVVERRWRDLVPVALVVWALLAGGFPAVTAYALYAVVAYAVVRAVTHDRDGRAVLRAALVSASGVVAGILLSAWQLLPFVHQSLNVLNFEARAQNPRSHPHWTSMTTTLVPDILGGPVGQHWAVTRNPVEMFHHVGATAFVLILVGFVATAPRSLRAVKAFFYTGIALCVALMYVGGPLLGLFQNLPIFSNNYIGRLSSMLGFFTAVAVALGLGAVMSRLEGSTTATGRPVVEEAASRGGTGATGAAAPSAGSAGAAAAPSTRRRRGLGVLTSTGTRAALAVVVALGAAVAVHRVAGFAPAEAAAEVRRDALVAGLLVLGSALLLALAWWRRSRLLGLVVAVAIPAMVAVPAIDVTSTWWPKGDPEMFFAETPTHDFLADNLGADRFITVAQTMLPGSSTAYGLRAANGHAFHTEEWRQLLRQVDPKVMLTPTYSSLTGADLATQLDSPVLDRMAVRYVAMPSAMVLPGLHERTGEPTESVRLGDGTTASTVVTGPMRGVVVHLPHGMGVDEDGAQVEVTAVGLPSDEGGDHVTVRVVERTMHEGAIWVPIPGEDLGAAEETEIVVEIVGVPATVDVLVDETGELLLDVVRPADDELELVHTGGAMVVERETALPRVRWAGDEVVVTDPEERLELLSSEELGDDTVVLERAQDAAGVSGSTAEVTVVQDGTDTIEVEVRAEDEGWLVVADSVRGGGWHAYLDGAEVPYVSADHAMGAVLVPAGEHEVRLEYHAPQMVLGLWISGATALLLLALLLGGRRRRTESTESTGTPKNTETAETADTAETTEPSATPDPEPQRER